VDDESTYSSHHGEIPALQLLAAITGTAPTVTQLCVPDKTSEFSCSKALLTPYDQTDATSPRMRCTVSASTPTSPSRRTRRTTPSS